MTTGMIPTLKEVPKIHVRPASPPITSSGLYDVQVTGWTQ